MKSAQLSSKPYLGQVIRLKVATKACFHSYHPKNIVEAGILSIYLIPKDKTTVTRRKHS